MPRSGVAVRRDDDLYDEAREWHGLEWESLTARDRRRPRLSSAAATPARAARSAHSAAAVTERAVRRTERAVRRTEPVVRRTEPVVGRTEPAARRSPEPRAQRPRPAFDDAPRPRAPGAPARRTVTIRGQGAERYVPARSDRTRPRAGRRYESPGFRPDRAAMWAVLLCILMIVIAAASAHAATLQALARLH